MPPGTVYALYARFLTLNRRFSVYLVSLDLTAAVQYINAVIVHNRRRINAAPGCEAFYFFTVGGIHDVNSAELRSVNNFISDRDGSGKPRVRFIRSYPPYFLAVCRVQRIYVVFLPGHDHHVVHDVDRLDASVIEAP